MKSMTLGLAVGAFIIIFSYFLRFADEVFQAVFVFNLLFVCMFFPLNGSLRRKMAALLVGNFICFTWNTLFFMFVNAVSTYAGGGFTALLAFISPFLNLLWFVSFWSTSLTFLAKPERGKW